MWRCYSSITDEWVSDWLSEEDYKQFLIKEETERIKEHLDAHGITKTTWVTYEEITYDMALKEKFCDDCPQGRCDCEDCKYNITLETYIQDGDDYLGIMDELKGAKE